jgi:prefoldin subunit 5
MALPESNPRGIPRSPFIDNIEEFLRDRDADSVLKKLQEQYSKYKFMESQLSQKKILIKSKLPDIKRTLESVNFMIAKKQNTITTHFQLSDGVYASASINDPSTVCLWLGANVMVEYTFEEAVALLSRNYEGATAQLRTIIEDLDFLKDQITTTEVNVARVYNHDVKLRRSKKDADEKDGKESPQIETTTA